MSRVSKANVEGLLKFLLKKRSEKIEEVKLEIKKYIDTLVFKRIPFEVCSIQKLFPGYFRLTYDVQVSGFGFNYEYFSSLTSHVRNEEGHYTQLVLEKEEAITLGKLNTKLKLLEKEKTSLKSDLEKLIYSLKTSTKIIETIPDSKEFFDSLGMNTQVAVIPENTVEILKRLKDG